MKLIATKKLGLSLVVLLSIILYSACNLIKEDSINKEEKLVEEEKSVKEDTERKVGLQIGNKAPELKFPNPNGKSVALSDLKGKMVLIDFWASWCGPCRLENPNVVKTYKKFKNSKFAHGKGFTVYSVSLDKNKAAWQNAIMQDGLAWPNHVSDLKAWNAEGAKIYHVRSIPQAYLIDGRGVIVAKGKSLRGGGLNTTLKHFEK